MKYSVLFLIGIGLLIALLASIFPGRLSAHGDGPQLVQLTLFGALVCSGVIFHYRNRLSDAFRHGLIWVGLMFLLVLGYSFKDQLIATLIPGRIQANEDGTLVAQKAEDGHFYLELGMNGVSVRLMVDTGASSTTLDAATAKRIGLNTNTLRYTAEISTANGRTYAAPATVPLVTFADREFANVPVFVAQQGALEHPLLGMNFLKRFSRVTAEGDRLIITP